jgi:cytochrome c553
MPAMPCKITRLSVSRPALSAIVLCIFAAIPLAQAADIKAGQAKAKVTCRVCHGLDGLGKMPTVPNLAGEGAIYISKQLKAFRSGERTHQQMSIIAQGLSDEDIANVAAYYSAIRVTVELPE